MIIQTKSLPESLRALLSGYRKRSVSVVVRPDDSSLGRPASYWDGGSRDWTTFYTVPVGCPTARPQVHSPEGAAPQGYPSFRAGDDVPMLSGDGSSYCMSVTTGVFCGKEAMATFHLPASLAAALGLTEGAERAGEGGAL